MMRKRRAAVAVCNLTAFNGESHSMIMAAGGVEALIELVRGGSDSINTDAVLSLVRVTHSSWQQAVPRR
eukprot:3339570-Prymnesium_polylepis.1